MAPFGGTLWSKDFSEEAFLKVKIGMSSIEVIKLLGNPVHKDSDFFWKYTIGDTGSADFDQRWVVFNKQGKVSEVRKSFFVD